MRKEINWRKYIILKKRGVGYLQKGFTSEMSSVKKQVNHQVTIKINPNA